MYLLIQYPAGLVVEAIVLGQARNRLRVAAPGFPDALELRRSGSQWRTANKERVELEFLMSCGQQLPEPESCGKRLNAAS